MSALGGRALTPQELRALLDHVQDALFMTDPSGGVVFMNAAAKDLYGFEDRIESRGGTSRLRAHVTDVFDVRTLDGRPVRDEDLPVVRALRGEAYRDVELMLKRNGDDDFRVYVFSSHRTGGDPPLSLLSVRDETDRWRSERRYRVAFETDPAPAVIVRLTDRRIVEANEGMSELTGLERHLLVSRKLTDLKPLRQVDDLDAAIERLRGGARIHKLKRRLLSADGTTVHVLISARAIEVEGEACGIFTYIDISELETAQHALQESQERLRTTLLEHADERAVMAYLATIDPLTQIPNRRALTAQLSDEFLRAERYGNVFSVMLLDLDHFKAVNDAYGHDAGDIVLFEVARLLQEACREADLVGRWGGEEFIMILPESDSAAARDLASRVCERIGQERFTGIGGLTTSIGVASYEAGVTVSTLLKRADRALYAAKSGGRNRVEVASAHEAAHVVEP